MSLTVTTRTSRSRSSSPIIEAYLQRASAAVAQLLTVVAEEFERDHPSLSDRAEERLRELATCASTVRNLLLGSD